MAEILLNIGFMFFAIFAIGFSRWCIFEIIKSLLDDEEIDD